MHILQIGQTTQLPPWRVPASRRRLKSWLALRHVWIKTSTRHGVSQSSGKRTFFKPLALTDFGSLFSSVITLHPTTMERCSRILFSYLRDLQSLIDLSPLIAELTWEMWTPIALEDLRYWQTSSGSDVSPYHSSDVRGKWRWITPELDEMNDDGGRNE